MAGRPIWRGRLRLALVSCPVALHTAKHDAASLHFHLINAWTGNRVRTVTQDAATGGALARGDLGLVALSRVVIARRERAPGVSMPWR